MKRSMLPTAVFAFLLLAPLASLAQKPPPQDEEKVGELTVSVKPRTPTYPETLTVSGKLTGVEGRRNIPVTLKGNAAPFKGAAELVDTTTTNAKGVYAFKVKPLLSTRYQTSAPLAQATSKKVLIQVRIRVTLKIGDRTPKAGDLVEFTGTAAPDHDERVVYIQRRTESGRWRTQGRTVLRDAGVELSEFSRRIRVRRDGVYRARVIHNFDHAPGTSRPKSVDVAGR